jgi:hypothetical protein
MGSIFLQQ